MDDSHFVSDEGKDTTRKYLRGEISKAAYYNAIRKATEDYQRALGLRPKHERRVDADLAALGWTRDEALAVRGLFSCIAEDWDDPAMDVYDSL